MAKVKVQTVDVKKYGDYENVPHILVDVREVNEYSEGHLPGAINIPLSSFQSRYTEIPTDKSVVLVCRTGGRSGMAAEMLASTGVYTNVVNLNGGTLDWVRAGNPVEK